MEMEYLNDNTLRVFIAADDLASRGISLMDILSDRKQVEKFFMSILEEADVSNKFRHSDAVTFQVMPSRGGIDLYITKSSGDGEETDTSLIDNLLDSMDTDEEKETGENTPALFQSGDLKQGEEPDPDFQEGRLAIEFDNFDDFLDFAENFDADLLQADVDLFAYKDHYYALIHFYGGALAQESLEDLVYGFMEFGRLTPLRLPVLREHGNLLIQDNATERVRDVFRL